MDRGLQNLYFPDFIIFFYLSKSAGNCKLADKQKTKKVREIQIIQILVKAKFF